MDQENTCTMEENVSIDTSTDIQNDDIFPLLEEYEINKREIAFMFTIIDELRQRNVKLERLIYKECNHEWQRDFSDTGPYSRVEYICKHCKLYK
jgi:hypothetical protein